MKKKHFMLLLTAIIFVTLLSVGFVACNKGETAGKIVGYVGECFYDGIKLTWDKVTDAETYDIIINGEKAATITASDNPSYECDLADFESVSVQINTNYVDYNSDLKTNDGSTNNLVRHSFDIPSLNYGVFSWPAVDGADGYWVKLGTEQPILVKDTKFSEYTENSGTISVRPNCKSSTDFYAFSAPKTYDIISAPEVSFNKTTCSICWETVPDAAGYNVSIVKDGKNSIDIPDFGQYSNIYSSFKFNEVGEYVVSVAAKGDSSSGKNDSVKSSFKVIRLAAPEDVSSVEESNSVVISWSSAAATAKYKILLPTLEFVTVSDLNYRFGLTSSLYEEMYEFKVYSVGTDNYTLDSSDFMKITVTQLESVKSVKIQDSRVIWDPVVKAEGYVVNVDGTEHPVNGTQYVIDVANGVHTIKVKAIGNGKELVSSNYTTGLIVKKLQAPTNLKIANYTLSWDAVDGASSYSVLMQNGNTLYNSNINSVTILSSDIIETTSLQVVARGNGNDTIDSNLSQTKVLYSLDVPMNVTATPVGVSWTEVPNALSYQVNVGDYITNVTGTSCSLDAYPANTYTIVVKAIGNGMVYFDSGESKAISVRKLSNVIFNMTDKGIEWHTIAQANGYQIMVDNATPSAVSSNVTSRDLSFDMAGKHTIAVRAIGDGIETIASSWTTEEIESVILQTPASFSVTRDGEDFVVETSTVENAIGYLFKIAGKVYESETPVFRFPAPNPVSVQISVAAKGNHITSINSNYTQDKTITLLSDVTNVKYRKQDSSLYTVTWDPVNNAQGYQVVCKKYNGAGEEISSNGIFISQASVDVAVDGVAKIEMYIYAKGDSLVTFDGKEVKSAKILGA